MIYSHLSNYVSCYSTKDVENSKVLTEVINKVVGCEKLTELEFNHMYEVDLELLERLTYMKSMRRLVLFNLRSLYKFEESYSKGYMDVIRRIICKQVLPALEEINRSHAVMVQLYRQPCR